MITENFQTVFVRIRNGTGIITNINLAICHHRAVAIFSKPNNARAFAKIPTGDKYIFIGSACARRNAGNYHIAVFTFWHLGAGFYSETNTIALGIVKMAFYFYANRATAQLWYYGP